MSALKSVLLAIELATREREEVGKVLAHVQRGRVGAKDQMDQLQSYAADTESRWALGSQPQTAPEIMRHYHQFMERLRQAMGLQALALTALDKEFALAKGRLLAAEMRIASLNQLLGKKQARFHKQQAGREQRQMDEFSALQQRRLRAAFDTLEIP